MNEWVTVRKRERERYLYYWEKSLLKSTSEVLTIARDFRHTLETLYKRQSKSAHKVSVGTPDVRRDFRRVSTAGKGRDYWRSCEEEVSQRPGVRTSDACRDFRHERVQNLASGVPTHVGTSDVHSLRATRRQFRPTSRLPTPVVTEKVSKCM